MVFGIAALRAKVEALSAQLMTLTGQVAKLSALLSGLTTKTGRLERAAERIENTMPTRADIDAAKAELAQAIQDAANRVTATIADLQNQIANGNPITQADLDDLKNDVTALSQVDVAPTPPPPLAP